MDILAGEPCSESLQEERSFESNDPDVSSLVREGGRVELFQLNDGSGCLAATAVVVVVVVVGGGSARWGGSLPSLVRLDQRTFAAVLDPFTF